MASPDDSLMLLKPTGAVPHAGGQLLKPGEPYYEIVRSWIADGARLDLATAAGVEDRGLPRQPDRAADRREAADAGAGDLRRRARPRRDPRGVHRERQHRGRHWRPGRGLMTAVRRGEAPILARYEGAYAATTLTVMGDRSGFVWEQPPAYNRDRRAGRREVAAAEDQALRPLHRRRVPPPGLPRPDRPAPLGRRGPRLPGRHPRHPGQARRAGRPPDRQPGVHRVLDEQVGRPAPGQPQVPRHRGGGRIPQVDPRGGGREHAVRPVRRGRS